MIIVMPEEFYIKVKRRGIDELEIEDRKLDYNIDFFRESTSSEMELDDKYKPILDQEQVYKRNFLDEIDEEYAKNAVSKNQIIN